MKLTNAPTHTHMHPLIVCTNPELSLSILPSDPFADAIKGANEDVQDGLVHIRIQQRSGRKTLTTVQGLSAEYDLKKIVRACKKVSPHIYLCLFLSTC